MQQVTFFPESLLNIKNESLLKVDFNLLNIG